LQQEVRLSGSGGQGLILGGIILASAAMKEGKNVIQTQSYGPEARGGASKAEVIISTDEIDYPKVINPDIMLAMTQKACDKYHSSLKENGILILDSTYVKKIPSTSAKIYSLPISQIAKKEVGKVIVANMVALGALIGFTDIVSFEILEEAVLARIPKGTEKLNKTALNLGYQAAQDWLQK
jgi:2-oxoglutarate ferredoxin oxidoreductase subunit gamma